MKKLLTIAGTMMLVWAAWGSSRAEAACETYYDPYGGSFTYDSATGLYGCSLRNATVHVIYMHGRSMQNWPMVAQIDVNQMPSNWDVQNPIYNGNNRLADYYTNLAIKNHLRTYCTGAHSCVVVGYSAGVTRFAFANQQLIAEGTPLTNLLYVHAIASCLGGTPLSRYTSKWWKAFIAKLFGKDAPIDKDIHDTSWTPSYTGGSTAYSSYQNSIPRTVWHVGNGLKDTCVKIKILFFKKKMCGNKEMPGRYGDGAVPVFSACGFAQRGAYTACNAAASKWTNRLWDTNGGAYYSADNHESNFATGSRLAGLRAVSLASTPPNSGSSIPSSYAEGDCSTANDECDMRESEGINWFHTYMQAADEATANFRPHTCDGSAACVATSQGDFTKQDCYTDPYSGTGWCSWLWVYNGVTKYCYDYSMNEDMPDTSTCY